MCRVLRIDHTFKVANSVRMKVGGTSRKCYGAMLTGCNELGLVLMAVMTKTKYNPDMEIPLQGIAARDPDKLPETVITDNPAGDETIINKIFPGSQLLGDFFHGLQHFGKSVKGYGRNAGSIMKDVSVALWKTVAGPSTGKAQKHYANSSEDFEKGVDLVLKHGLANKVKINTNKWMAAKARMVSLFAQGYYDMPKMGAYIDAPGLGSVTTRGTNAEETFHRCIRGFVKAGQTCAVTVHALIIFFTAKYDLNKISRLRGTPSGAVVMDLKMNNANRLLSYELCLLVNDDAGMAQLNSSNPLKDWAIVQPLDHSKNTFVGVLTRTGDSDAVVRNYEEAVRRFEKATSNDDNEDDEIEHDEHMNREVEKMCSREVRY